MGESSSTVITVANPSRVQIFVGLIFAGVACPRKLVPNENFCVYVRIKWMVHSSQSIKMVRTFHCHVDNPCSSSRLSDLGMKSVLRSEYALIFEVCLATYL